MPQLLDRFVSRSSRPGYGTVDRRVENLDHALAANGFGTCQLRLPDLRGRWSAEAASLLGLGGERPDDSELPVHPSDRAWVQKAIGRSLSEGLPVDLEFRVRLDGRSRWVRLCGAGLDEHSLTGILSDVTEQKARENALLQVTRRIEEELQASHSRFEHMLDNLPQGVWSTRADGYYDYYNRRWYEFTGAAPGAANGHGWKDFIHPEDQQRIWCEWQRCIATGDPYEAEYRLRHFSGEYFWTLGRARPARSETGKIMSWYGSCSLIHERVLAQQALDASEALNRSIIEATPDPIKLLSLSGDILFANDASVQMCAPTARRPSNWW